MKNCLHRFFSKYRHALQAFLKLVICAIATAAFIACVARFYPESDFHFWGYVMFAVLYLIVMLAIVNMYRCFNIGTLRRREIVISFFISMLFTNFIMYFVLCLLCKFIINPLPLGAVTFFQFFCGALILLLMNALFFLLRPSRDAIVICSGDQYESETMGKFSQMRDSYRICEVVPESAGFDTIAEKIKNYNTVISGQIGSALRQKIVNLCYEQNKRLFVLPTIQDIILHSSHETFVGDSVTYLCRNRPFTLEQLAVKRLMDIFISLFGIVLTSPLMLISALIIKLQDGGPIFFRQERYTRNLETFTLIKFRSMVVDAEKDGARFTTDHDPRITPYGRFMRRIRIDELPQFFNILKGDMSLVGPRAERIENVESYCRMLPEFSYRTKVKAGLTGYAQIYGKYNTSPEDKLKMDLLYIENCSITQDIQLLFQTVRVLFLPESTEGFTTATLQEPENQSPSEDRSGD